MALKGRIKEPQEPRDPGWLSKCCYKPVIQQFIYISYTDKPYLKIAQACRCGKCGQLQTFVPLLAMEQSNIKPQNVIKLLNTSILCAFRLQELQTGKMDEVPW